MMRYSARVCLPVVGAMALLACSDPNGAEGGNNSAALGNDAVEVPRSFTAEEGPSDTGRALCLNAAIRRFGFSPDDVTGSTFAGGGETPQTIDAQVTLNLYGPPARDFRCEIRAGAVVSVEELELDREPVADENSAN